MGSTPPKWLPFAPIFARWAMDINAPHDWLVHQWLLVFESL
jgi:hypothetical protein